MCSDRNLRKAFRKNNHNYGIEWPADLVRELNHGLGEREPDEILSFARLHPDYFRGIRPAEAKAKGPGQGLHYLSPDIGVGQKKIKN